MQNYKFRRNESIGNLEAETDSFLESCFYSSSVFKGIVNFDSNEDNPDFTKRIIVGRTGSGKTALLKQIARYDRIKVYDSIEAENTVFEHIHNNVFISSLIRQDIDLRAFYKSLWLHVLLVKVIEQVYRKSYSSFFEYINVLPKKKPYKPEEAKEYLKSFKDNFFNDNVVSEITEKMQSELSGKLKSSNINLAGKISSENQAKIQRETSSYVSRELIKKQKELIKIIKGEFSDNRQQHKIVIGIDDLDQSWLSSSEIRYDFINALLEAFKELLDIKSVKILISIRTDILMGIYRNNLRQDEKDLSLIHAISWNKSEIRGMLDLRINHLIKSKYRSAESVTFADVFNFDILGVRADDYIIERTMLRPRDAIDFINSCLSECDGDIDLNEDIILEAEEKFYSKRKRALEKEWKSIFFYAHDYIDALSILDKVEFKVSELTDAMKDEISNLLYNRPYSESLDPNHDNRIIDLNELIKVWFTIGILGIKKSETLCIYSSFEKQELDITDLNKTFKIHPLFFRY